MSGGGNKDCFDGRKRLQTLRPVLVITLLPLLSAAAGAPPSPLSGNGVAQDPGYTAEEKAELDALSEVVQSFEESAKEYREATRQLIEKKYKERRDMLYQSYERKIVKLEAEQRQRRDEAIARFESFIGKYPEEERYTPDAMFRLAELYFERSYEDYYQAHKTFEDALAAWTPKSGAAEPVEPVFHYEPTIAIMERLITEFPDYRLVDGAYYLLGYCLGEQGEEERAVDVYHELVAKSPNSRFAAEVWMRIGEFYFNTNELDLALDAYTKVLPFADSPFYDKALYKLAWTHYRLADPERAPEHFQLAVDTFVKLLDFNEKSKAAGEDKGGDLRNESIQYVAISYADEQWGGTDKLIGYLDGKGDVPYARDLIVALGDVYFDQTRFADAVRAYRIAQERYPNDSEAPVVQDKIVQALERSRDFEGAAVERNLLTQNYSEGSTWFEKNLGNPDALAKANELTEKALYSAAVFHHRQAQIHREAGKVELAKAEYGKAATAYGAYLKRFPHDRQLYELTFYHAECLYYSLQFEDAAREYKKVRDSTEDNKFLEDAAFSLILSYENAVKVAEATGKLQPVPVKKSSERPPGEAPTPKPIPEIKLAAVEAADVYARLRPDSERVPKVLYKAAEVFYVYDHFDEARRRFRELIAHYPQGELAEFATNLIIESYLVEQNYAAVESFAREQLAASGAQQNKKFSTELVKFKAGAMFKIAEQLEEQGEHEKAAELYLKLLDENPDNQFGDSALNNAAVAYEKAKRYDSASKLYERLVQRYPKSPLADGALFRVGLNAERFFDFDKATATYMRLVERYPKSERRADAIFNAALSLENTQEYERAARMYLRYCDLFRDREDAPNVCFRAGLVYEKMGEPRRVVSTYEGFVKKYKKQSAHADRVLEAYLKMAQAYDKLGGEREAQKYYALTVHEYQKRPDSKSAPYAAQAQFQLVERDFAKFHALRISGNSKEQKRALTKKAEELKKVEAKYQAILGFKQFEWTLASLFRIGQLYQDFADSLVGAPCPQDVRRAARKIGATAAEVCDEYSVILEERAVAVEDKAVAAYETTINKAREFQVANIWTKKTLVALNKLRPHSWPLQKEAKFQLDEVALSPPAVVDAGGLAVAPKAVEKEQAAQAETAGGKAHAPVDGKAGSNASDGKEDQR